MGVGVALVGAAALAFVLTTPQLPAARATSSAEDGGTTQYGGSIDWTDVVNSTLTFTNDLGTDLVLQSGSAYQADITAPDEILPGATVSFPVSLGSDNLSWGSESMPEDDAADAVYTRYDNNASIDLHLQGSQYWNDCSDSPLRADVNSLNGVDWSVLTTTDSIQTSVRMPTSHMSVDYDDTCPLLLNGSSMTLTSTPQLAVNAGVVMNAGSMPMPFEASDFYDMDGFVVDNAGQWAWYGSGVIDPVVVKVPRTNDYFNGIGGLTVTTSGSAVGDSASLVGTFLVNGSETSEPDWDQLTMSGTVHSVSASGTPTVYVNGSIWGGTQLCMYLTL